MKPSLKVVKIGGDILESPTKLTKALLAFTQLEGVKILVHGGGKMATDFGQKIGITTKMIEGRRVTDEESLVLITMVYGGLVNKKMVGQLQGMGCNAIGLTGADANLITAKMRSKQPVDFGFVGDVTAVDKAKMAALLNIKLTPVFAAITHDGNGQLLNTNADTIASEIAIAMSDQFETILYYCFEKNGVLAKLDDENSVIERLDEKTYKQLVNDNSIVDGMLPKLSTSFTALHRGVTRIYIGKSTMLSNLSNPHTTLFL